MPQHRADDLPSALTVLSKCCHPTTLTTLPESYFLVPTACGAIISIPLADMNHTLYP